MSKQLVKSIILCFLIIAGMFLVAFLAGNSVKKINIDKYNKAITLYDSNKYPEAEKLFHELGDFKDSKDMKQKASCMIEINEAKKEIDKGNYDLALERLDSITKEFDDIYDKKQSLIYEEAVNLYENSQYNTAELFFERIKDYEDSNVYLTQIEVKVIEEKKYDLYKLALVDYENEDYEEALEKFKDLNDYKKSNDYILKCQDMLNRCAKNKTISGGVNNTVAISNEGNIYYTNSYNSNFEKTKYWTNIVSVDTYDEVIAAIDLNNNLYTAGKCDNKDIVFDRTSDCIDIATGQQFALALYSDGKVEANGHNDDGQCDVSDWDDIIDIDAGWRFSVGLNSEGKLLFAGICDEQLEEYLEEEDLWKDVVTISASGGGETAIEGNTHGKGHTVGLKKDGTVVAVGDNTYGQCDVDEWSDIVKIAAGDWYTVGLKNDGTVLITGNNKPKLRYVDEQMFNGNYVDIAAGYGQTICLDSEGNISVFGFDDYGKNTRTDDWKGIKVSNYH